MMKTPEERLSNYPSKPRTKRVHWGYLPHPTDPLLMVPNPEAVLILDEGLDQLDSGLSLRLVGDWINGRLALGKVLDHTGTLITLSHSGLRKLQDDYRKETKVPKKPAVKLRRLTREERSERIRKRKISDEKRRIQNAHRRINKHQEEIGIIKDNHIVEDRNNLLVELDYEAPEFKEIESEVEVVFKPNPGPQTAFFAATEQEVLYGGAAGGGKSYALIADPMRYFSNPNFRGLILRRTNDELRELIWNTQLLYPRTFPDSVWREKDKEWRFPAGGRLWMSYLERDEDVQRYQGQAFTYIGFDELTQYGTPFAWNYMRSRLRTVDPDLPLFMRATSNPGGPGHGWVKRMFIDPAVPGKAFWARDLETGNVLVYPRGHEKAGQPLFERRFIPAKLVDNPYYSDGNYETNLLSLPEQQRRQLLDGDWNIADGAAFPEFRSEIHVIPAFKIDRNWRRFRSCDYGYSTRQASAVHWYTVDPSTDQIIVYRELYVNQLTGKELARKILQIEADAGEKMAYGVLDSSVWAKRGQEGPSIAEEMIAEGCRWRPADRSQGSRIAGKNRLHELLRVDPFNNKPGIVFFDSCRQIIADLPVIPADKDSDDIDSKYASDHAYDSIRYGIMTRPKSGFDPFGFSGRPQGRWRPSSVEFGY